jgi:methionyl-tRNA formyltransferase
VIYHAKAHGSLPSTPQDEEFATKAPSLSDGKH